MANAAVRLQSNNHNLTWVAYPNYETTETGDNIEPPGAIDLVRPVLTHNYESLRQRCIQLTGNRGIARGEQAAYKEAFKKATDVEREYLKEGFEAGYDSLLQHQAETADLLEKANECQVFSQKFFEYLKAKEASRQRTITDPDSEASDVEKATTQKKRIVECLPFVSAGLLTLGARIPFIEKYLREQKAALENFTPSLSYRERMSQWWNRSREASEKDLEGKQADTNEVPSNSSNTSEETEDIDETMDPKQTPQAVKKPMKEKPSAHQSPPQSENSPSKADKKKPTQTGKQASCQSIGTRRRNKGLSGKLKRLGFSS